MSAAELLQVLFYFSGIISVMLGVFSLYIDSKAKLNRTFFAISISLCIWAIGFSMAIHAPNIDMCMFWRRISAIGWGSMYSIMLHYCLVFTKKDKLLKKWWTYLLIYIPAVITIYVFSISNSMALQQYNLIRTSFGWTNISVSNGWDMFFNVYYAGYTLCGLGFVWEFGKYSKSDLVKRQVKLMLNSFFIAFLLGSVTDIIFNSIYSIQIPQIAPIIILLPNSVIYYSIFRYGLMNSKQAVRAEVILDESNRTKIYTNISVTLVVVSLISYIVQYLFYKNLVQPLYSSGFILLLGITVHFLKKIKVGEYTMDILLIGLVSIAIPSVTLIFVQYGSMTIWAFPFLFIIISLLFNKPIVLGSIAISTISTQILVWILRPEVHLTLDTFDHLGRIGIIGFSVWFAFYVNKIYIKRLSQNAEQLNLQRFISEISSDFINVNKSNIDEKINWVIRILGKLFSIDQINILSFDLENSTINYTNIWGVREKGINKSHMNHVNKEVISWLVNNLISNESIYIPEVDKLPENAFGVKNEFKHRQVGSLVAMPLAENKDTIKVLEFASINRVKEWPDEEYRVLKIIANIFADAMSKVEAENGMTYMAYHDHLTGLPNRRLFNDRLNQAIALAKRTEKLIGLVFVDIDSFKTINDTLGHDGGDALLKIVSEKLIKAVRKADTVSRFGGDEFIVMINNLSSDKDIIPIVEKIMSILGEPFSIDGQEFNLTTSAGIAMYPFDGTDAESLIRNADISMYKAKEKGKDQYVICSSDLKDEVLYNIKITNSLYHALERDEFYLYYQPQVSIPHGGIIGLEALIRWKHPELGFVSPAVFIPIAEQNGLINQIGEWVIKTACKQNRKWQKAGNTPVRIAVNVSANQLRNQNFVLQIKNILEEAELDPSFLEIEITESAAMNETDDTVKLLNDIRNLGVMISIDDFGTDYSSLSRLNELPIDKIKIDKRFIDGIEKGEKGQMIVRTIINLSKNLNLKVIAEGVENENQLDYLRQHLCDEVQGYYYYRPMSAEDIEKI
ncbi:MAG: EAL domain-containing protein [Solirubrobacterales bacterium]